MKVTIPKLDLTSNTSLIDLVRYVARLIEGRGYNPNYPFYPRQLLDGDNSVWVLDKHNEYKITFTEGEKDSFKLTYKYGESKKIKAICELVIIEYS